MEVAGYEGTPTIMLIVLLLPGGGTITASPDQTYMEITFDGKTIGGPIGMGGSGIGEPFYVSEDIEAIVRGTPFDTPSLEIHNTSPTNVGLVEFRFPGSPVESGLVVIIMDLWF